ncbi:MAG: hypothetical protein AAFX02_04740 [Pseudomonadota bacterium]
MFSFLRRLFGGQGTPEQQVSMQPGSSSNRSTAEPEIVRKWSVEECEIRRQKALDEVIIPNVSFYFDRFEAFQSAVLFVSQYWCDEAHDAVHNNLLFSLYDAPDFTAHRARIDQFEVSEEAKEASELVWEAHEYLFEPDEAVPLLMKHLEGRDCFEVFYDDYAVHLKRIYKKSWKAPFWDENNEMIPAFAAFCPELGSQEDHPLHSAAPYAIFRRGAEGTITTEIICEMIRPWLDGVAPEWERNS